MKIARTPLTGQCARYLATAAPDAPHAGAAWERLGPGAYRRQGRALAAEEEAATDPVLAHPGPN